MSQALAHPAVRLSLDSAGPVDGTWWPHSTDAATELPGLVSAVDQRLETRTLRIGLHVDAWNNIPRRFPAPGRDVRVGWFRVMDPGLITLSLSGGRIITLRVEEPR